MTLLPQDTLVGKCVPDFSAPSTSRTFSLHQNAGTPLILFFYPKDSTPGCTTEAMQFRDRHAGFQAQGCTVIGVSRDSLKSHERFKAKFALPFDLIADTNESVCRLFDVIKAKNMYGKQVQGIERSTFLIGADGVVRAAWRKVKADGHADAVLHELVKARAERG